MPLLLFSASLPFGGALCLSMCAALLFWRFVFTVRAAFRIKKQLKTC